MARILAVDDDRAILDVLGRVLRRAGHEVVGEADSTRVPAMDLGRFDLILCDVMMPGLDGFELVRQIRGRVDAPILFLTAKVAEEDAVTGYGLGADDYIRKPFGAAELRAKVDAHLRRERREHHSALRLGRVRFDLAAREVWVEGEADGSGTPGAGAEAGTGAEAAPDALVPLSPTEYAICEYLARHRGQVFSRDQIREAVLGWGSEASEATVSMHVSNARAKLRAAGVEPIATAWGVGYRWEA